MRHLPGFSHCLHLGLLLLLVSLPLLPQPAEIDPGYQHFYNNEFDQALAYFEAQLAAHPADPELNNHLAQTLLYREMLRNGALESQLVSGNNPFLRRPKMEPSSADKQQILSTISNSMTLSHARLAQNPHDTVALYALSVAHGLKSNYLFLVEKSWLDALREATAARKAAESVLQIDPGNVDARLVIGLNHYIVGSLPLHMRVLGFLGGFKGDRKGGIRDLQLVSQQGKRNHYDADVLLAAIYRREKDPEKALPLLKNLASTFPRNYLFRLELVQIYSDAGVKQSALAVLAQVSRLHSERAPGFSDIPEGKIEYTSGNLLFWYNDLNPAIENLKIATRHAATLDLNTAVLAWLRLGQAYDLQGNRTDAVTAYRQTLEIAPKSEVADEARSFIKAPYHRKASNG